LLSSTSTAVHAIAGDSERQIEDVDPLVAVDDAFAPDGVEIGERLFRGGPAPAAADVSS